jgi:hypothetical protein
LFSFLRKLQEKNGIWVWWFMLVIPATLDAEEGGHPSEAKLGTSARPYLKNKLGKKKWVWLKW